MMDFLDNAARARRRLPVLICLAALALLASVVPAVAATGQQSTASQAPSGSRCSASYLQSALHLAQVTVDSAALDTTGSFTPPGQPTISGLPDFCDVALTQTDPAGNPVHIYVWLPDPWNGRFQGVGGAVYECGPIFTDPRGRPQSEASVSGAGGRSSGPRERTVPDWSAARPGLRYQ